MTMTQALLQLGGDDRIALLAHTGANRYGCMATPDRHVLAFGSCTASSISCASYDKVQALAQRLAHERTLLADTVVYSQELNRIRGSLTALNCLDAVPGTEIVFAASGTDAHLLAAQLVAGSPELPTRVIFMGANEIGSGVPQALAGMHFNATTAYGTHVVAGTAIAADRCLDTVSVAVREPDGSARDCAAIDAEVEALVLQSVQRRQPVLLVPVDGTKTGLIVPSVGCVRALAERHRQYLDVLVDACQFRMSAATLQSYLAQNFMVALTGSKFLSGPAFSAALFIPHGLAQRLRKRPLPDTLSAYSSRSDWPADWMGATSLADWANFGLLMRWEAALEELRAFRTVPSSAANTFCVAFAKAVHDRLTYDPAFLLLPIPQLLRAGLVDSADGKSWDTVPTIFTFLLRDTAVSGLSLLDKVRTRAIYVALQAGAATETHQPQRFQLGQPVDCGERDGVAVSALRLCVSAPMIVKAAARHDGGAGIIDQAMQALDRVAQLACAPGLLISCKN